MSFKSPALEEYVSDNLNMYANSLFDSENSLRTEFQRGHFRSIVCDVSASPEIHSITGAKPIRETYHEALNFLLNAFSYILRKDFMDKWDDGKEYQPIYAVISKIQSRSISFVKHCKAIERTLKEFYPNCDFSIDEEYFSEINSSMLLTIKCMENRYKSKEKKSKSKI